MSGNYTWLFPFEYVKQGSKIVIYGAGTMGQEYWRQLVITKYATIIAFIDKNYRAYNESVIPVYPVEKIYELSFDYLVLGFQTEVYVREIKSTLVKNGIDENKIVFTSARPAVTEGLIIGKNKNKSKKIIYAYKKNVISIAIKLSGAVGDNIVRKKVLESFVNLVPDCAIDIYSPVADKFLPAFYLGFKNIANFINDSGGRYIEQSPHYSVALTIANFIIMDELHVDKLQMKYHEFYTKMQLLKKRCIEQEIDFSMPVYTHFMKNIKRGKNYYTSYDYDGVFDIDDKNAHIYINKKYKKIYDGLNLRKYITINYGNAISMKNEKIVAKQWPKDNFFVLVKLIKNNFSDVEIVQLGNDDAEKICGIDKYILGEDMELVKYVLNNSILHIDIEGGLVHLATQLETKCVVLFGPTQVEYFGYDENINIKAGNCHNCCGMYKDINKCARDMEKPECMYSITPQMVFDKIEKYFKSIGII